MSENQNHPYIGWFSVSLAPLDQPAKAVNESPGRLRRPGDFNSRLFFTYFLSVKYALPK